MLDPQQLVRWLYQPGNHVRVASETHAMLPLPSPVQLAELLSVAEQNGFQWVLLDGPRPMRNYWVLDPWWSDQPEMTERMLQTTQARCAELSPLREALLDRASDPLTS